MTTLQTESSRPRRLTVATEAKPITVTVRSACELTCLGTTKINELIQNGTLKSVKVGKRRLVLMDSIEALLTPAA